MVRPSVYSPMGECSLRPADDNGTDRQADPSCRTDPVFWCQ